MAYNNRSRKVTQGVARSANRAMYYAMGYKDEDFDKPVMPRVCTSLSIRRVLTPSR